jgi:hypothetical protein
VQNDGKKITLSIYDGEKRLDYPMNPKDALRLALRILNEAAT